MQRSSRIQERSFGVTTLEPTSGACSLAAAGLERPVPASDVPWERLATTQPFPTKPPPFGRQGFTEDDLVDFTPEIKAKALEAIKGLRLGDIFTPPSLEGTLLMPGVWGVANWGGAAFDPETAILYVKATNWPFVFKVGKPKTGTADGSDRRRHSDPQTALLDAHRDRPERRRARVADPAR